MADRDLSGRTLGEFVLREQIGEGGYGAVYRCDQPVLQRSAVIKVLRERRRGDEIAQERFFREARLASRLDHPYAAHIYAFGVTDDDDGELLWIAMELVDGIALSDWLETRGPMPLDQFVAFFECVADVVQAAHDRGIVHRDLKPSNVMVIERGGRLFPKLLDFGIAKASPELGTSPPDAGAAGETELERAPGRRSPADALAAEQRPATDVVTVKLHPRPSNRAQTLTDSGIRAQSGATQRSVTGSELTLTPTGIPFGSLPYMSPEQWIEAGDVGPAADVYSLGIMAYETLTGCVPFLGDSPDDYCRAHCHGAVPRLAGPFPPELDHAIQQALAKRPGDRHASALIFAAALRAALRASERELLRTSAQQWDARARPASLLLGGDLLTDVERWARRAPSGVLSKLECSYVAESQRRARRVAWLRRAVVAIVAVSVVGWLQYRTTMQARMVEQRAKLEARAAQRVAEATVTQAELEQGRSALLHGEPDAPEHLFKAYEHDRSPSTAFMLARALQPRLAEQLHLKSSSGRMWSAIFSPDGQQIVTTDDRNAQVHDAYTGQLLLTLPHSGPVYQAMYNAGGTQIVTVCDDGAVRVWDAKHGELIRELRSPQRKLRYFIVAVSSDDRFVAAIDVNGALTDVWNMASGALVAEVPNDGSEFPAIGFSADGRWLAVTGGNDVQLLDMRIKALVSTIRGPLIQSLAFDPTGPRLLTGATTGDVSVWSIPDGARLRHLRETGEPIDAVAFAHDGKYVAAISRDGAGQVWHSASGKLQSQFNPRHSKALAIEFDPMSRLVLAANADGTAAVVDAVSGMTVALLQGPQNVARTAHFDSSSRRVVGASLEGTAWAWDAAMPYRQWTSSPVADDCGIGTSPTPDTRFIAVGCRDLPTRIWDTSRDLLLAVLPSVSRVPGDFTSAFPMVSSAGDRAAIARSHTVEIYEIPSGRLLETVSHTALVNAVAFGPTGHDLVSGAVDGTLLVTRNGVTHALPTSTGGVDAVTFLPDDRIASADARGRLRVYHANGEIAADLAIPMRVVALRAEGDRLVTIPSYPSTGASPLLVDVERYRIVAPLEGHVGRVFSARWVAGHQLLTAGGDGTVRRWDGSTGALRQVYRGGSRFLVDAAVTVDGFVMAGGADGLLRFWDQASGRPLWTLPAHKSMLIGIHMEGDDIVTRGFAGEVSRWRLPQPERVVQAAVRETAALSSHDEESTAKTHAL
jgi:serine/threonine protein kinase/WD40 repeat protein